MTQLLPEPCRPIIRFTRSSRTSASCRGPKCRIVKCFISYTTLNRWKTYHLPPSLRIGIGLRKLYLRLELPQSPQCLYDDFGLLVVMTFQQVFYEAELFFAIMAFVHVPIMAIDHKSMSMVTVHLKVELQTIRIRFGLKREASPKVRGEQVHVSS